MERGTSYQVISYGVACLSLPGQAESGDSYLVKEHDRGVLIAVVDGLGHGQEAAYTAEMAKSALEEHSSTNPLSLLLYCHEKLRRTRGAAITVVSLDKVAGTLTWTGVGNVECVLLRSRPAEDAPKREYIILRGGVIGYHLPSIYPTVTTIHPGDIIIFCTDGVSREFLESASLGMEPQELADVILRRYSLKTDDALVLVARYNGGPHGPSST